MKKTILFPLLFTSFFLLNAQQEEYQCIFQKDIESGLRSIMLGGVTFNHLQVKSNTMPGIEAGFLINDKLLLGIYGEGTTGNFAQLYGEEYHHILLGEGGFMVGYVSNANKTMHFGSALKLGYVALIADDKEMKLFNSSETIARDNGITYHPELFCEINLAPFMKVKVGGGYSFYLLNNETVVCNTTIDSWTLNLGIVFGNFIKEH